MTPTPSPVDTLEGYLDALASDAPVPGGGSAAALAGAMAAALVGMVARIARRNPKNAAFAAAFDGIADSSDELRAQLAEARTSDEAAFSAVMAAQAMPRQSDGEQRERRQALDDALARAAEEPLRAIALNLQILELSQRLMEFPVDNLITDVGSAAELAAAAVASAAYNVRVNHRYMRDAEIVELQSSSLEEHEARAREMLDQTRAQVRPRLGKND